MIGKSLFLAATLALIVVCPAAFGADDITDLRVEYLNNPIGIDVAQPRFSWVVKSSRRGARQSAYRILLASDPRKLSENLADVWDSGKQSSSENAQIEYAGPLLQSRTRYHFKVLLWDEQDRGIAAKSGFFETGFFDLSQWHARFIGLRPAHDDERQPFIDSQWIAAAKATSKTQRLGFRADFDLAADEIVQQADLFLLGAGDLHNWLPRNKTQVWLNEKVASSFSADNKDPRHVNLLGLTKAGANRLVILSPAYEGQNFIAAIRIVLSSGQIRVFRSGENWLARGFDTLSAAKAWPEAAASDPELLPARQLGVFGQDLGPATVEVDHMVPAAYLRKSFSINKAIRQARVYATAAGVYELRMNGARVTDDMFSPGWTDYKKRIRYQSYDVTGLLRAGTNVIGGIVGDGWYAGRTGIGQHLWGFDKALAVQVHIAFTDGTESVITTDESWVGTTGPIRKSDMLDGESYDARRELAGWDKAGYDASTWRPVFTPVVAVGKLGSQPEPAVRITRELPAKSVSPRAAGAQIFDLGQNMVGWVSLRLNAPRGTRVILRYAEVLNTDGTLFTDNLRSAAATDEYFAKGRAGEVFEPHFTLHGFRYVQVSGLAQPLPAIAIVGKLINSNLREVGAFATSNALLNQLQSNILFSQRGNFVSVPTDCPQRDERLGWSGDIQVFARTAVFNMDAATFLAKYIVDLQDTQTPDGSVANIAPTIEEIGGGAYGWGDALVILPHLLYETYGDRRIIERHYSGMKKWVDFRTSQAKGFLNREGSFGDWLATETTPHEVLSPIFHAHVSALLARMAAVIGKVQDAEKYTELSRNIRKAWVAAFVKRDGSIASDTQTAYAMALRYKMLPVELEALASDRLQAAITRAHGHLATGFLGTGHLLPSLSQSGKDEVAFDLLLNETFPSWLYPIRNGATTIWERWDSYSPETGPSNIGGMNSYNHYAYGAVGEWMYSNIAGIDFDHDPSAAVGFANVVIRPVVGGGLSSANGSYQSIRGTIKTSWRLAHGRFLLDVEIPVHSAAVVHVPAASADTPILESDLPISKSVGVSPLGFSAGFARYKVGPGRYRFSVHFNAGI